MMMIQIIQWIIILLTKHNVSPDRNGTFSHALCLKKHCKSALSNAPVVNKT